MPPRHVYEEFLPAVALRRYVECYWHASSEGAPGFRPLEPLVPDLKIEFIVNAGEPYGWSPGPSEPIRHAATFSCIGMRATALTVQQIGSLDHFAIRFRPTGLRAFLKVPLNVVTQRCVDVDALWDDRSCRELESRIVEASSVADRIQAADQFLLARIRPDADAVDLTRHCVMSLLSTMGTTSIAGVARANGIGYKRLERLFMRDVGLTPKRFAKIVRLQRALARASPRMSLAALAPLAGYADQPHMSREFQSLVGFTPGAFFIERFAIFETMKASGAIGHGRLGPLEGPTVGTPKR